jgi:hypothetical protein
MELFSSGFWDLILLMMSLPVIAFFVIVGYYIIKILKKFSDKL